MWSVKFNSILINLIEVPAKIIEFSKNTEKVYFGMGSMRFASILFEILKFLAATYLLDF